MRSVQGRPVPPTIAGYLRHRRPEPARRSILLRPEPGIGPAIPRSDRPKHTVLHPSTEQ